MFIAFLLFCCCATAHSYTLRRLSAIPSACVGSCAEADVVLLGGPPALSSVALGDFSTSFPGETMITEDEDGLSTAMVVVGGELLPAVVSTGATDLLTYYSSCSCTYAISPVPGVLTRTVVNVSNAPMMHYGQAVGGADLCIQSYNSSVHEVTFGVQRRMLYNETYPSYWWAGTECTAMVRVTAFLGDATTSFSTQSVTIIHNDTDHHHIMGGRAVGVSYSNLTGNCTFRSRLISGGSLSTHIMHAFSCPSTTGPCNGTVVHLCVSGGDSAIIRTEVTRGGETFLASDVTIVTNTRCGWGWVVPGETIGCYLANVRLEGYGRVVSSFVSWCLWGLVMHLPLYALGLLVRQVTKDAEAPRVASGRHVVGLAGILRPPQSRFYWRWIPAALGAVVRVMNVVTYCVGFAAGPILVSAALLLLARDGSPGHEEASLGEAIAFLISGIIYSLWRVMLVVYLWYRRNGQIKWWYAIFAFCTYTGVFGQIVSVSMVPICVNGTCNSTISTEAFYRTGVTTFQVADASLEVEFRHVVKWVEDDGYWSPIGGAPIAGLNGSALAGYCSAKDCTYGKAAGAVARNGGVAGLYGIRNLQLCVRSPPTDDQRTYTINHLDEWPLYNLKLVSDSTDACSSDYYRNALRVTVPFGVGVPIPGHRDFGADSIAKGICTSGSATCAAGLCDYTDYNWLAEFDAARAWGSVNGTILTGRSSRCAEHFNHHTTVVSLIVDQHQFPGYPDGRIEPDFYVYVSRGGLMHDISYRVNGGAWLRDVVYPVVVPFEVQTDVANITGEVIIEQPATSPDPPPLPLVYTYKAVNYTDGPFAFTLAGSPGTWYGCTGSGWAPTGISTPYAAGELQVLQPTYFSEHVPLSRTLWTGSGAIDQMSFAVDVLPAARTGDAVRSCSQPREGEDGGQSRIEHALGHYGYSNVTFGYTNGAITLTALPPIVPGGRVSVRGTAITYNEVRCQVVLMSVTVSKVYPANPALASVHNVSMRTIGGTCVVRLTFSFEEDNVVVDRSTTVGEGVGYYTFDVTPTRHARGVTVTGRTQYVTLAGQMSGHESTVLLVYSNESLFLDIYAASQSQEPGWHSDTLDEPIVTHGGGISGGRGVLGAIAGFFGSIGHAFTSASGFLGIGSTVGSAIAKVAVIGGVVLAVVLGVWVFMKLRRNGGGIKMGWIGRGGGELPQYDEGIGKQSSYPGADGMRRRKPTDTERKSSGPWRVV